MSQTIKSNRSLVMENPKLLAIHDEEIIQFFSRSMKITAVPVLIIIAAITVILYLDLNSQLIWLWLALALLLQIPRYWVALRIGDTTTGSIKHRMKLALLPGAISGISLSTVVVFAPQMSIEAKALISIILVGTAAGSLTTSHWFKPIYLSFVVPLFLAIIVIWFSDGVGEVSTTYSVIMLLLTLQLAALFLNLLTRAHSTYCASLVLQERTTEALRTEKLANSAKTRFLAAASHDLRQPLHTMALFSAALAMRPLDEKSKSIATKMNEAMKDLADELDSLLDISKLDAGVVAVESASLDLSSLVSRVTSLFKPRTEQKKLDLHIDVQEQLFVHSDAKLIERLLRNILDNAVKYTHEGSVTCSLHSQDGSAVISVIDTGPGIDSVDHEHIWEEFYQIDNESRDRQQGLGLGLSVVSRLAKLLDIRVRLVPQIGKGARFEIAIPVYLPEPSQDAIEHLDPYKAESELLKGRHVLVVDDDDDIQLGTEALLKGMGMHVSLASGSMTAIEQFKSKPIDVVLMDLRLADGDDGFYAIKKLKAIDDQVPMIVMSGDTAPDRLKTAESIGCTWLVKPVKLELLVAEFERIFR